LVNPLHPKRFENRARPACYRTVRANQLYRFYERLVWYLRISVARLLGCRVRHPVTGYLAPVVDPDAAEPTMAVVEQNWLPISHLVHYALFGRQFWSCQNPVKMVLTTGALLGILTIR
jgi:hypothetical protein